ncbi:putative 1-alkyl-2-acetylglycerophosphocholine esterase [Colletotrichum spaethianum]|uniref:1-alkyl-2-acetylglycerophosphocholine esterase n=1 Tax=Colletotrichum spaethianum TaxID=700344 RepID=A0AA37PDB0_9PEZI|nr:putative 1-alkyl-2-acetylglycerophosphocholine esterase [Colletotrichum spaethianum]GKT50094.1 putative 1-alkyl-2-acetylglycerophosphocholine esterase [Colletotrichum spaethianum]
MLLSFFVGLASVAAAVVIPGPPGPHPVALRVQAFEDAARWDPHAPKNQPEKRRLMVSVHVPLKKNTSCSVETVPYMPPETAAFYGQLATAMFGLPSTLFLGTEFEFCSVRTACGYRLGHGILARSLASYGYIVVTLDHTYDSAMVEFPDGSLLDASVAGPLLKGTQASVDADRIFVAGHSLGGATAAASLRADDRVLGGLNFDGSLWGPVTTEGTDRPLVLVSTPTTFDYISGWNEIWSHLRGPSLIVVIEGTTHMSFFDAPQLPAVLALPAEYDELVKEVLGTIDGETLATIEVELLRRTMDLALGGKKDALCDVEDISPEVGQLHAKNLSCP